MDAGGRTNQETESRSLVSATLKNHTSMRVSPIVYLGTRYRGTVFLGYFLWGEQQEVTRHRGETNIKKLLYVESIWSVSIDGNSLLKGENKC